MKNKKIVRTKGEVARFYDDVCKFDKITDDHHLCIAMGIQHCFDWLTNKKVHSLEWLCPDNNEIWGEDNQ